MDRISPFAGANLNAPNREKAKVEKKKPVRGLFSSLLSDAEKASAVFESQVQFDDSPLESLLDAVHERGEELKIHPSFSSIKSYREAVGAFINAVVRRSLHAETVEGARFNPLKKQKRFTMIRIIDEKLTQLAEGILAEQREQLDILARVDEINGLLVDLLE